MRIDVSSSTLLPTEPVGDRFEVVLPAGAPALDGLAERLAFVVALDTGEFKQ
jgi:hypothetical protein